MDASETRLVSVIIPCYNQGEYLREAIDSALRQSYSSFEIIVVDDGSTDNTALIATQYERVKCIRQENRGLAAARNAGMRASKGEYLVFLDADDRLLENALEAGVNSLDAHPHCAFVSGQYSLIAADGSAIASAERPLIEAEHYVALLRGNYIGMHAAVMYRREALDSVGGFDTSRRACEDYDLYLRLARNFSAHSHRTIVAEYRQHKTNMSRNYKLMMESSLSVLRSQWKFVKGDQKRKEAYKQGIRFWRDYCAKGLIKQAQGSLKAGEPTLAFQTMLGVLRYHPREFFRRGGRSVIRKLSRGPNALFSKLIDLHNKS